jgi:LytS/YehU family sensor histidine kinase
VLACWNLSVNKLRNRFAFSLLWINIAAVSVVLIVLAENGWNLHDLSRALAYALLYANLSGILGYLLISDVAERLARRNVPVMPVVAIGVVLVTGVSCLLAETLLMAFGYVTARYFWAEYRGTLKIALPLAFVFALGAVVYGSLRDRLQQAERKLHEKEIAEQRTRKLEAESRLRLLESRIHPHFLFNTLNSVMSLIVSNPGKAERVVGQLSSLLRASLDTTERRLIPLREELEMVQSYLEIERARFEDKLQSLAHLLQLDVPVELEGAMVAPMSIQTLVENAVKHGITPLDGGGRIVIKAVEKAGSLHIQVLDTGPGFELAAIRAGHGLDNLVQRLDSLFGAQARLNVTKSDGYSLVEMIVPLT